MHDMHNNVDAIRAISPVAVGTTGTGLSSQIIDRRGYGGVEFIIGYGTVTATNATVTITLLEGDTTGALTSVAAADLLGTEANAGLAAATRTSGTSKNVTKRVGYKGGKRYVQLKEVPTVSAGVLISVDAILHNPQVGPVDD